MADVQMVEVPGLGKIAFPKGTPSAVMDAEIASTLKRHKLNIPDSPLVGQIMEEAKRQGVDPHLAIRVAHQESRFDPAAVSKRGAKGIFQLMPGTAREMGVEDPHDPEQNIRGGVGYLAKMIAHYKGDVKQALAAYNWGMGNLAANGIEKAPAETRDYLAKIMLSAPVVPSGPAPVAPAAARPGPTTPPPASGPDPRLTGLAPPKKAYTPTLAQTAAEMGEEMDPISRLGVGAVQAFNRTARGLGLHRALKAAGMKLDDSEDTGTVMSGVAEGAGGLATIGDIAGTGTQVVAAAPKAAAALPAAVRGWAARNPALSTAVGAGGMTAAMTPGGVEERGKEGLIAGTFGGVLTKALSKVAKPAAMNKDAENLYKATGEVPPLHVGAESQLLQDIGQLSKGLPGVGKQIKSAEDRMVGTSVRQLFQNATPPGAPNVITPGKSVQRGQIFQDLQAQYDDAYRTLLTGRRISVTNADRAAITRIIDKDLTPDDAAIAHRVIGQYFPQHSGRIGGQSWKELQDIIRENAEKYSSADTVVKKKIGAVFNQIDDHLIKMRNKGVPADVAHNLDLTDNARRNGKLLQEAIADAGGEAGLSPKMLADALRKRHTTAEIAQGTAPGQQIIDPLAATLGTAKSPTTMSALMGMHRLAIPAGAAGLLAGIPGAAAVPAGLVGLNALGATQRGAKLMFGMTETQKRLAELLRNNPDAISRAATTLQLQTED